MEWTLYYDGGCNLCHYSQLRVERWANKVNQPLRVEILQGPLALEKGYAGAEMVLEADTVYRGADAWIKLMSVAPWYLNWIPKIANVSLFRKLLRWGYGLVAKYRYRLFGRRACSLPRPSIETAPST